MVFVLLTIYGCGKSTDIDEGSKDFTSAESFNDTEGENYIEEPVVLPPVMYSVHIYEEDIPDNCEFMNSFTFPNRLGDTNNSLIVNSTAGFKGFEEQGEMYVSVSDAVESFDLFINDYRVDTDSLPGKTVKIDFSEISKNGNNELIVTNIKPSDIEKCVTVNIKYPSVIEGAPENVGIDSEIFDFIDLLVSSDVEYGFPSAQMAVIKDGMLIYENSWGYLNSYNRDLTRKTELISVDNDTLYDLASNTKMYSVNYAVQYLVTNGLLDIDTPVSKIIGVNFVEDTVEVSYSGYKNPGLKTNKEWKSKITVKDLLCHRAGFPASPKYEILNSNPGNSSINASMINPLFSGCDNSLETREKTLESICKTPLMYEPGTKIIYSDVDFMLLCFIVEKVTGKRIDVFLDEVFFEPMGLSHITYNPLDNGFGVDDCAATELQGNSREGAVNFDGIRDYTIQGNVHDEEAYFAMAGISGHAGLFSNARDLAVLANVMLTGGYENNAYFSQEVIDLFTSPQSEDSADWAIGWWRNGGEGRPWYFGPEAQSNVFGHQGWTGTLTVIDPDNNLVVVFLTNKINSPLINKNVNSNKFEGNVFTTGGLGFSTQLIYMGLNADEEKLEDKLLSISAQMVADSVALIPENGGASKDDAAVRNAYSKLNVLVNLAEEINSPSAWNYVENALSLFDENRDITEITGFRARMEEYMY